MMDWLYSKITVIVVVFILIAFFAAFFLWNTEDIALTEVQNTADEIASRVNEIGAISGSTNITISFDQYRQGAVYIPPTINDQAYTITIMPDQVILDYQGAMITSVLTHPRLPDNNIHFWESTQYQYTTSAMEDLDISNPDITIESGNDFILERKMVEVSAHYEHHTFVFLATV